MIVTVPKGHAPMIRISWPCTPWADHNGWLSLFPGVMSHWFISSDLAPFGWIVTVGWFTPFGWVVIVGWFAPLGYIAPCCWWSMIIASLARYLWVYTLVMCGLCLCLSNSFTVSRTASPAAIRRMAWEATSPRLIEPATLATLLAKLDESTPSNVYKVFPSWQKRT